MIDPTPLVNKYLPGWTVRFSEGNEFYGEAHLQQKEIEFLPEACDEIEYEVGQKCIVLHEIAHGMLGRGGHDNDFYTILGALVIANDIPIEVAQIMEWRNPDFLALDSPETV